MTSIRCRSDADLSSLFFTFILDLGGMLQSWNQFCFTGGYIEVAISLPGDTETLGLWCVVLAVALASKDSYQS